MAFRGRLSKKCLPNCEFLDFWGTPPNFDPPPNFGSNFGEFWTPPEFLPPPKNSVFVDAQFFDQFLDQLFGDKNL